MFFIDGHWLLQTLWLLKKCLLWAKAMPSLIEAVFKLESQQLPLSCMLAMAGKCHLSLLLHATSNSLTDPGWSRMIRSCCRVLKIFNPRWSWNPSGCYTGIRPDKMHLPCCSSSHARHAVPSHSAPGCLPDCGCWLGWCHPVVAAAAALHMDHHCGYCAVCLPPPSDLQSVFRPGRQITDR